MSPRELILLVSGNSGGVSSGVVELPAEGDAVAMLQEDGTLWLKEDGTQAYEE